MTETPCSQCDVSTPDDALVAEGACPDCVAAYERYHVEAYVAERWRQLSDAERDAEIRNEIRRSS